MTISSIYIYTSEGKKESYAPFMKKGTIHDMLMVNSVMVCNNEH